MDDLGEFRNAPLLDEYQRLAARTNRVGGGLRDDVDPVDTLGLLVPLLGMAGEVGSLLAEVKKFIRDGPAHPLFPDHVREELGDILWYLASSAGRFGFSLSDLAFSNLEKTRRRWAATGEDARPYQMFDDDRAEVEQLPRQFSVEVLDVQDQDGLWHVELRVDGVVVGDHLRDNSQREDYYRFHDVFHLAHAAMLGWSPVVRGKLLDRKRRSPDGGERIDEVEDGGRAIVIEEAVVAYVWGYATDHRFLVDATTIDYAVLRTIEQLTSGLEVAERTLYEWEEAILAGYAVFREVRDRGRGVIECDLLSRTVNVVA